MNGGVHKEGTGQVTGPLQFGGVFSGVSGGKARCFEEKEVKQ